MRIDNWIILVLMTGLVCACSSNPDIATVDENHSDSDSGIVLTNEIVDEAGIRFGDIEQKMLSHDISARGKIVLLPDKNASVSVMMGGVIQSIRVSYGQKVKKGEVLATYAHPEFIEIQQHYLNSRTKLELMEKEFQRQETLWKEKVKSEKEFQLAEMEYNNAKADFQSAKAKINMLKMDLTSLNRGKISVEVPIVSPIGGEVEEISITMGQYVDMNDPIFKVIDKSAPVLQLKVFEKDIHLIENNQRVTFSSATSGPDEYEAEIFNVGSTVVQDARVIFVMAKIASKVSGLIPGMFVSSTIHTREQILNALPESAVVIENEQKKYGYYTLDEKGSREYRFYPFDLTTGFSEDGYVEIYPGFELPDNARIVISGVYYLKSEMMKTIGD